MLKAGLILTSSLDLPHKAELKINYLGAVPGTPGESHDERKEVQEGLRIATLLS